MATQLSTAALHPAVRGRTFNLGRDLAIDNRDWLRRFAERAGWTREVRETAAPAGSPLSSLDLRYPLLVDTGAFRIACSWSEPTPLAEALDRTLADERARSGGADGR